MEEEKQGGRGRDESGERRWRKRSKEGEEEAKESLMDRIFPLFRFIESSSDEMRRTGPMRRRKRQKKKGKKRQKRKRKKWQ